MKTLAKILVTLLVIVVILLFAAGPIQSCVNSAIIEDEASSYFGDDSGISGLVSAVLAGEDLTDEEIIGALDVDSSAYYQVKEAAAEAGVDFNDSEQLRDVAFANVGNVGEIEGVISDLQSGEISGSEAASELESIIEIPE